LFGIGPPKDLQLAELLKLTRDQIALVFRVPLPVLGVAEVSASTTEQLYAAWLASGLGFALNHLEEAFGDLFNLKGQPDEYCEWDTEALLRSARKERVEMLVRGVQGGLFSPNEARAAEDLPAVPFGSEPRVQAQNVPLSAVAMVPAAPVPPSAPAAPVEGSKAYQAQVERAVEDMRTLARKSVATTDKPSARANANGVTLPSEAVRKTKTNGSQPPTLNK
jgi:hypothetical protein